MSEDLKNLSPEALIDFALAHLGPEGTALRQAALQEHATRTQTDPNTQIAPPGDTELLRAHLARLQPPAST